MPPIAISAAYRTSEIFADKTARNSAIEFHNQAMAMVRQDPQLAYRLLCSATTVDPTMAQGWYMLGNCCADLKMLPASIAAFTRVLELPVGDKSGDCTPELRAKAMVNLGHRMLNAGRIEDAFEVSRRAIDILEADPSLDQEGRAFAWTNMSLVLSILGDVVGSLEYARRAYEMSQTAIIETGLAFALLFSGDYAEGLRRFEARFEYRLPQYLSYPYARWQGDRVGTLFVAADQGIGDTLSFARFVPEVASRVGRVLFQVQPELLRLMQGAMAPWKNVEVIPQTTAFPLADVWCPVFSLPTALDLTTKQIREYPQRWKAPNGWWSCPERMEGTGAEGEVTEADIKKRSRRIVSTLNGYPPSDWSNDEFYGTVAEWKNRCAPNGWKAPGRRLHVGIAYGGSPLNDIDVWRSIPVSMFLELYRVPGVQLYSLQVGDRVKDLHDAGCAALIRDMSPWIRDATDTVAIMRELDLVVTIESFIGHLAGAVGVPCWTLVSRRGGDWRCGRMGDRPLWYERTRLFRQGEDGEWPAVFDHVVAALEEMTDADRSGSRVSGDHADRGHARARQLAGNRRGIIG